VVFLSKNVTRTKNYPTEQITHPTESKTH
jgi:hypothetical protein